jgi:hypothetical protein
MWIEMDVVQHGNREPRRTLLCITLVIALLYNPFLTVLSSSLNISVQHPVSYRATLASSEFQRCTLETQKPHIPALLAVFFFFVAGFVRSDEISFVQPSDSIVPHSNAASHGIWFRPPPIIA